MICIQPKSMTTKPGSLFLRACAQLPACCRLGATRLHGCQDQQGRAAQLPAGEVAASYEALHRALQSLRRYRPQDSDQQRQILALALGLLVGRLSLLVAATSSFQSWTGEHPPIGCSLGIREAGAAQLSHCYSKPGHTSPCTPEAPSNLCAACFPHCHSCSCCCSYWVRQQLAASRKLIGCCRKQFRVPGGVGRCKDDLEQIRGDVCQVPQVQPPHRPCAFTNENVLDDLLARCPVNTATEKVINDNTSDKFQACTCVCAMFPVCTHAIAGCLRSGRDSMTML